MFTNISWPDYITYVATATIIYYIVIGLKYFRNDLADTFASKRSGRSETLFMEEEHQERDFPLGEDKPVFFETSTDQDFDDVEELIARIKEIVAKSAHLEVQTGDFKKYLGLTLNEYPSIKKSALRASVNELIVSECQKNGTVKLSMDEVDLLW
ncbi:hypothetical protein [Flavobacterium cerinum]|uniref:Uncharacterized protein n=1 Tax=Flavobacterium cerinum TaxID=2502784 RepID=A0ABY5IQY4_9FLAO|nr:hypothetical protein [Flavobacterium cerinum]UUC44193.1 hypothetical protein NOX80_11165 [Flavobacterium cerinum]